MNIGFMMKSIKYIPLAVTAATLFTACNEALTLADVSQKPVTISVSGYSKIDNVQLVLNGEPVVINGNDRYTGKIETILKFVAGKDETNILAIYNSDAAKELASHQISYDNAGDIGQLNFFNLPEIYLEASVEKPTVRLGYVGYEFIFPNLGELSHVTTDSIKGVLKKEDGTVLAEFGAIRKKSFTEVLSYRSFGYSEPVYLELFKQGTQEPYFGSQTLRVKLKQDAGPNLIVLQEYLDESGKPGVTGDIDIADYL